MKRISFNEDWTFTIAEAARYWWVTPYKKKVTIPHDYNTEIKRMESARGRANNAYNADGAFDYIKRFEFPGEWNNQRIILEFEGVYMNAAVYCNGNLITRHPYGYTEFHCDITSYINFGFENEIKVTINSCQPNSRWYSGLGIYRPVWLLIGNDVMIEPWGTYITTTGKRKVNVTTDITNNSDKSQDVTVINSIIDASGAKVSELLENIQINPKESKHVDIKFDNYDFKLWSPENPYLYTMNTKLLVDVNVLDDENTTFGVRDISITREHGLMINGKEYKLKGGCVHHDCGILGAASYEGAEYRKVRLHKENGYNAIRAAHNPPSRAFLKACDEIGILVIDEIFDCWRVPKTINDYSVYFEKYWQDDVDSMVRRDRNHPSIIMWSTGNEIPERDGKSGGYKTSKELADYIRNIDDTRYITNAVCIVYDRPERFAEVTEQFMNPLDVVGYNYMPEKYKCDGEMFSDRIMYGSESYAKDIFGIWKETMKYSYVIGDFVWTSLDYIGECGIGRSTYSEEDNAFLADFPWRYATCGDIDICGIKRPQSYYRDCVWNNRIKPFIGVHDLTKDYEKEHISGWGFADLIDSWSFNGCNGKLAHVEVFTCADEVELLVNEKSYGIKKAGIENEYKVMFEVPYQPGSIEAIAYNGGKCAARTRIVTPGLCTAIKTTVEYEKGLAYVMIEGVDSGGNLCTEADRTVTVNPADGEHLLGLGNADPLSEEIYTQSTCRLYRGRALAIIQTCSDNIIMTEII